MFEWLEEELVSTKDRKFHMVRENAPILPGWQKHEIDWPVPPPVEYQNFIDLFSAAFLYRDLGNWYIRIFARPMIHKDRTETSFLYFGGFDSYRAMFHFDRLKETGDSPVYQDNSLRYKEMGNFADWLENCAKKARKRYTKKEWRKILEGPPPFSPEEEKIVGARSKYKWKKTGVTPDGQLLIEVTNESDMTLPYLTFNLTILNRDLVGGLWLPVNSVAPGQTQVFSEFAYARLTSIDDIEINLAPDPWPEDRKIYWEFGRDNE